MKQAVLGHWDLPWLPITALMIFVICFVCYSYWTFKKENRSFYDQAALMPLLDENQKNISLEGK